MRECKHSEADPASVRRAVRQTICLRHCGRPSGPIGFVCGIWRAGTTSGGGGTHTHERARVRIAHNNRIVYPGENYSLFTKIICEQNKYVTLHVKCIIMSRWARTRAPALLAGGWLGRPADAAAAVCIMAAVRGGITLHL